jgi:regulator of sigma E protease
MDYLLAAFGAIVAILIIIMLHEGGHFVMARVLGVRVLRFSIGFGKPIFRWVSKKSGTEYTVGTLPLGGYVRMHGDESEEASRQDPDSYFAQPLWKRFLIVIAGPLVNFILAIVIVWGLLLTGVHYIAPVVGQVTQGSPAQKAKLQPNDLIVSVDGHTTRSWQQVVMQIMQAVGRKGPVHVGVQANMQGDTIYKELPLWKLDFNKKTLSPLEELGIAPYYPPMKATISEVVPNSPAAKAGLQSGETVVAVNGKAIDGWRKLVPIIQGHAGKRMVWTVEANGKRQQKTIALGRRALNEKTYGYAGFMVAKPQWPARMQRVETFGVFSAWVPAWDRVWGLMAFKVGVLAKLVTGDLPVKVMGGPVSIFQAAGKATLAGWQVYWQFVAIISLSIGFINLLPIPGLDGGHILYQLIELIRRRPLSLRVQRIGVATGMLLLLAFMLQVTFYDLGRLFNF